MIGDQAEVAGVHLAPGVLERIGQCARGDGEPEQQGPEAGAEAGAEARPEAVGAVGATVRGAAGGPASTAVTPCDITPGMARYLPLSVLAPWTVGFVAWASAPVAVGAEPAEPQASDSAEAATAGDAGGLPALECVADQTGGFHDYPDDDDSYVPALFNSTPFRLEENVVFMTNLPEQPGVDLFVTLTAGEDPVTTELECRQVRGIDGSPGYSCVNIPPSEMLLINRQTWRFTRTAVGGWTFAGATAAESGESIFVEYGTCRPR